MLKKVALLVLLILLWTVNAFSYVKLNVPEELTENPEVSGFISDIYEYDFDNDGIKEKVLVNYKNNKNSDISAKVTISIYIMENGKYRFAYQLPLKNEISLFSMKRAEEALRKIKEHYGDYSKNIQQGEVRYVKLLDDNINDRIVFDMKFDKHSPKNLDNFIFVKKTTVFSQFPDYRSESAFIAKYKDKPRLLLEFLSLKDNKKKIWYFTEIEKNKIKIRGYVSNDKNTIQKRGFYWEEMYSKIEKVNDFINLAINDRTDMYTITEYRPLTHDFYSQKDKFGNRKNQSIVGYTRSDKKGETINIPDQTILRVVGKENGMLKIETPIYGGPYYIDDTSKILKKLDLKSEVNKFIVIDPNNQTEAILERIDNTDNFSIISYSFVTTGKDNGYSSYETPHGAFLVAFTRPYMMFTRNVRKDEDLSNIPRNKRVSNRNDVVVGGEAKYAVRFSGGAYMHGIPYSYGKNTETVKTAIAQKIGTYKESHKCVRHYDEQIEFIVNWINGNSTNKERDNTIPDEPVIAIVL